MRWTLPASYVQNLTRIGDELVDVLARKWYALDGCISYGRVNWAFRFDASVCCADHIVIYERFGTKALLLTEGGEHLVREIDRSFYCADDYEYPMSMFAQADGRLVMAHCPDEYHTIAID